MVHESGIPREQIVATFCDTGNEIEETYEHVRLMSEKIHPIETIYPPLDFYALARKKKRFPSTKARFCTQDLKMKPSKDYIDNLMREGFTVVAVSGVRADESFERSQLPEHGHPMDSYYGIEEWRPLLNWEIEDVFLIHKRYGIPMNPLYAQGAKRVGCFPCIMSRKSEIRLIADKWPERINFLRDQEWGDGVFRSFFARNKVPLTHRTKEITTKDGEQMLVATIDDVVAWTRTKDHKKKNQRQFVLDFWFDDEMSDDAGLCPSTMGTCE